jgi:hypothetical protein
MSREQEYIYRRKMEETKRKSGKSSEKGHNLLFGVNGRY